MPKKQTKPAPLEVPVRRPEDYDSSLELVVKQETLKMKLKSAFSQYTLYCNGKVSKRPLVCIFGESGSGKTFTVELLAKASGLPLTITSATSMSAPGYKGQNMQDQLAAHWMTHHTDMGVVFVDEVDKWCRGAIRLEKGQSVTMDEQLINGIKSQQEMLKYVEHETINFMDLGRDIDAMQGVQFDTRRLLWIFAGAFTGLPAAVRGRLWNQHLDNEEVWEQAQPADFIRYGMVEELARRVQTWAWTLPLTSIDLVRILNEQEVPYWRDAFAGIGCELEIQPAAVNTIALRSFEEHGGARGAMALMRRAMDDLYDQVSRKHLERFTVDHNIVETGRIDVDVA